MTSPWFPVAMSFGPAMAIFPILMPELPYLVRFCSMFIGVLAMTSTTVRLHRRVVQLECKQDDK